MSSRIARKVLARVRLEWMRVLWRALGKLKAQVTVSTRQGKLTVYTRDSVIAFHLYANHQYEWDLCTDVASWMSANTGWKKGTGTVLDLGANLGVIGIGFVRNGYFQHGVSVEPEPRNFELLQHNVAQNGLAKRIVCLRYALSDTPGVIKFGLDATNFGDHRVQQGDAAPDVAGRQVIEVESHSIDELLRSKVPGDVADDVALVWMDVQGFEGHAFRGGKELFTRDIPVVVEIWPFGLHRAGVTDAQFCEIAAGYWSSYWVHSKGRFVRYPIVALASYMADLGSLGDFENVIFTKQ